MYIYTMDELFTTLLQPRIDRTNLDTNKCYTRVRKVKGVEERTYVGMFVRSYRMGSGDGMQLYIEFNDSGRVTTISEDMWGSVSGDELSYFVEDSAMGASE